MKKSFLLGLATLALAAVATPASAQEVTYVPDCSQGLLQNRARDNWFITAQGGANMLFGPNDINAEIKNRIGPNAALFAGKWINPVFGFRFGVVWEIAKGATPYADAWDRYPKQGAINNGNAYPEKWMGFGPEFDVLINLTNWWCGYKPKRVYNAVLHGGTNAYFRWVKKGDKDNACYSYAHNTNLAVNLGLQNNFRLSDVVSLFVDVRYEMLDFKRLEHDLGLFAGITFNLGKSDWNCPVTAVCPTWKYTDAQGDELVRRLNAANNQINVLQDELDAARRKPAPAAKAANCDGLATVYYPINVATLSSREKTILRSVAEAMKANPDQKYTLTGWADNYTGNDEINTALRNRRVDGVKNFLVNCGVNADQLNVTTDPNNLTDFGAKSASLDRAVTIKVAD